MYGASRRNIDKHHVGFDLLQNATVNDSIKVQMKCQLSLVSYLFANNRHTNTGWSACGLASRPDSLFREFRNTMDNLRFDLAVFVWQFEKNCFFFQPAVEVSLGSCLICRKS